MIKRDLLICQCASLEHQAIVTTFDDEPKVYISIHMAKHSFLKRLWHGIKYILGYKCIYGDFEEIILHKEHITQVENILKQLETK